MSSDSLLIATVPDGFPATYDLTADSVERAVGTFYLMAYENGWLEKLDMSFVTGVQTSDTKLWTQGSPVGPQPTCGLTWPRRWKATASQMNYLKIDRLRRSIDKCMAQLKGGGVYAWAYLRVRTKLFERSRSIDWQPSSFAPCPTRGRGGGGHTREDLIRT